MVLPEPGFADHPDRLPLAHHEAHAVDGLHVPDGTAEEAAPDREPDFQVLGAGDRGRTRIARRGVALGLGGKQRPGVGVLRVGEDLSHSARFDDLALLHHDHVVGDAAHDVEVVGDEQHRHAELRLQVLEQLQDLGLHGDV